MSACIREAIPATTSAFMDMKGKESRFRIWQAFKFCNDQCTAFLWDEFHCPTQIRVRLPAMHAGNCCRSSIPYHTLSPCTAYAAAQVSRTVPLALGFPSTQQPWMVSSKNPRQKTSNDATLPGLVFSVCGLLCGQRKSASVSHQMNLKKFPKAKKHLKSLDFRCFFVVDDIGFEPMTSRTSSGCSYQLS